jgi:hypothetical protein
LWNASIQTSSAKTRAQIQRRDAPCDARPAAKRQKDKAESMAEEKALT